MMTATLSTPLASDKPEATAREPFRARGLLSTSDFQLLRAAHVRHSRAVTDPEERVRINALYHRFDAYG